MQEIELKKNDTRLKIYINGIPDVHLLSETEKNLFISQIEIIISEMFEKNEKRKKYRK